MIGLAAKQIENGGSCFSCGRVVSRWFHRVIFRCKTCIHVCMVVSLFPLARVLSLATDVTMAIAERKARYWAAAAAVNVSSSGGAARNLSSLPGAPCYTVVPPRPGACPMARGSSCRLSSRLCLLVWLLVLHVLSPVVSYHLSCLPFRPSRCP